MATAVRRSYPPIPYGMSDFSAIRREGYLYLAAAKEHLRGYLADERLAQENPGVRFAGVALVFRGWELVGAGAV